LLCPFDRSPSCVLAKFSRLLAPRSGQRETSVASSGQERRVVLPWRSCRIATGEDVEPPRRLRSGSPREPVPWGTRSGATMHRNSTGARARTVRRGPRAGGSRARTRPIALMASTWMGNGTRSVVLGAASLLVSLPSTAMRRSLSSRAAVGCRPALARVVSQGPSVARRRLWPGVQKQQIAPPNSYLLRLFPRPPTRRQSPDHLARSTKTSAAEVCRARRRGRRSRH
jgi:hypothetical protein